MSLVINSNQSDVSGQRQSNRMIPFGKYPDFTQCLIKPRFSWKFTIANWSTPASIGTKNWFSVNWTPVNFCSRALSESSYYKWTSTASDYWIAWRLHLNLTWSWYAPSQSSTFRISAPWKLSWWEIVWKNIQATLITYVYLAWRANTNYGRTEIKFQPWVLHSDWTITYSSDDTWRIQWPLQYACNLEVNFSWTTAWVEAQEWDILIVDVTVRMGTSQSIYWSDNFIEIWFWYDWSIDTYHWKDNTGVSYDNVDAISNMWPRPIQISIE